MISSFLKTPLRFAKFTSLIAAVALTAAVASNNARGATVVRAHGYTLQLNGEPFVIKGMNYSPVPIRAAPAFIP